MLRREREFFLFKKIKRENCVTEEERILFL